MTTERTWDERRTSALVIAATILLFGLVRLLAPRFFETPDEAKYVGVGMNILAGDGLVTIFGVPFPNHSPIWSLILAVPQAWFGLDGILIGQTINGLSAAALIGFAGALGWRVRPAVGAVAAVALLGFPFLFQLSRTAGLDLPAAALSLAYLVVGLRAVDRGSVGLAALAGLSFGLAFLFKETALPFAPIPFLAGSAWRRPWPRLLRLAAVTVFVAALVLGWWFVLHASITDQIYRLGAPAWLLGPSAVVLGVAIVIGWFVEPWLRRRGVDVDRPTERRWPVVLAWLGGLAWVGMQLIVYARAPKLGGVGLIRPTALIAYLSFTPQLALGLASMIPGSLLTIVVAARRRLDPVAWRELFPSVLTLAANLPLVLLVIGIGETPRHYIALFAVLAVVAAIGWVEIAVRSWRGEGWARAALAVAVVLVGVIAAIGARRVWVGVREAPLLFLALAVAALVVIAAVAAIASRRAAGRTIVPIVLGTALVCGAVGVAAATAARPVDNDQSKQAAIADTIAWIDANTQPGDVIAMSPLLAYEIGQRIRDEHRVVRIRPRSHVIDPNAALGLRPLGPDEGHAMAISPALRNVDQYEVIRAGEVAATLQEDRPVAWIHATVADGTPALTAALDRSAGLERAARWTYPFGSRTLEVGAYLVDPDAFAPDESVTFIEPIALERIVAAFEGGEGFADAAARLLEGLEVTPSSPDGPALLERLRAIAGG